MHSFLSSSHASQKSMFSSLYSVRKNSRKTLRPAGLFISLSKDCAQPRTSSGVGLALPDPGGEGKGTALRSAPGGLRVPRCVVPPRAARPCSSLVPSQRDCARTHPWCSFLLRLRLLRRLWEFAHGICPGSAWPGWSTGLVSAEFPKLRCILVPALDKPKREQKPFLQRSCSSDPARERLTLVHHPQQLGEAGKLLPSK